LALPGVAAVEKVDEQRLGLGARDRRRRELPLTLLFVATGEAKQATAALVARRRFEKEAARSGDRDMPSRLSRGPVDGGGDIAFSWAGDDFAVDVQ
jgi:hypothetical protein